jgi:hypothetical protein
MNCQTAQRIAKKRRTKNSAEDYTKTQRHLSHCPSCQVKLGGDGLGATLLRNYGTPLPGENLFPSPNFLARLRNRLASAQTSPGYNPWETVISAAQGWLLGFSMVTAALFAAFLFNFQAQPSPTNQSQDFNVEWLALPSKTENLLIATGEPLSQDAVLYIVTEDTDNGRK